MLPWFAGLMTAAGVALAALAAYVAWRRGTRAGLTLAVLLLSVAWWGLAYAVELSVGSIDAKTRWGDLKYAGVSLVAPAWLVFVLQYTGRSHLVTRRLLALLAVEPALVLAVLAVPATHDWVRSYPPDAAGDPLPVVQTGPVFWLHLVYSNVLIVVATWLFVVSMFRLAATYRRMATVLVVAALLPWTANLLHNLEVGPFARLDLTPFAFTVTGGVLVWGVYRERLVNLSPLARGMVMETMGDAVYVLDAFGRVADVNPAGAELLGRRHGEVIGLLVDDLFPVEVPGRERRGELRLGHGDARRIFDVARQPLADAGSAPAGELLVLREVTRRVRTEQQLQRLLVERTRVVEALQASLAPGTLPDLPYVELAAAYHPAGSGEIGGDFIDVFPLGAQDAGLVLGDVSGKGAEAAAVTALARYTLRTLADVADRPSETLRVLNERLVAQTDTERFCTLVYGVVRPRPDGVRLTLCLAGHHQPLLRRADARVDPVGRLGAVLGLLEQPDLVDTEVDAAPGDLLCLFTDGLVEARRGREQFGEERVAALLDREGHRPVADVAEALVTAVQEFRGGPLEDDLAILLVRVRADRRPGEVSGTD